MIRPAIEMPKKVHPTLGVTTEPTMPLVVTNKATLDTRNFFLSRSGIDITKPDQKLAYESFW